MTDSDKLLHKTYGEFHADHPGMTDFLWGLEPDFQCELIGLFNILEFWWADKESQIEDTNDE